MQDWAIQKGASVDNRVQFKNGAKFGKFVRNWVIALEIADAYVETLDGKWKY